MFSHIICVFGYVPQKFSISTKKIKSKAGKTHVVKSKKLQQ